MSIQEAEDSEEDWKNNRIDPAQLLLWQPNAYPNTTTTSDTSANPATHTHTNAPPPHQMISSLIAPQNPAISANYPPNQCNLIISSPNPIPTQITYNHHQYHNNNPPPHNYRSAPTTNIINNNHYWTPPINYLATYSAISNNVNNSIYFVNPISDQMPVNMSGNSNTLLHNDEHLTYTSYTDLIHQQQAGHNYSYGLYGGNSRDNVDNITNSSTVSHNLVGSTNLSISNSTNSSTTNPNYSYVNNMIYPNHSISTNSNYKHMGHNHYAAPNYELYNMMNPTGTSNYPPSSFHMNTLLSTTYNNHGMDSNYTSSYTNQSNMMKNISAETNFTNANISNDQGMPNTSDVADGNTIIIDRSSNLYSNIKRRRKSHIDDKKGSNVIREEVVDTVRMRDNYRNANDQSLTTSINAKASRPLEAGVDRKMINYAGFHDDDGADGGDDGDGESDDGDGDDDGGEGDGDAGGNNVVNFSRLPSTLRPLPLRRPTTTTLPRAPIHMSNAGYVSAAGQQGPRSDAGVAAARFKRSSAPSASACASSAASTMPRGPGRGRGRGLGASLAGGGRSAPSDRITTSTVAPMAAGSASSKDRHSKVQTYKGLRDRRVRLSVSTALQFYDIQDRLGFQQPSRVFEWLIDKAKHAIDQLPPPA